MARPHEGPAPVRGASRWSSGLRLHPDLFPDLLAAALKKEDVAEWAGRSGITVGR